jgi:hypothetical protein
MNKKLKIFLVSLLILGLMGFAGYTYVMKGGERNLSEEETAFTTTSPLILSEFATNSDAANTKYLEKAVAISGKVTAVTPNQIVLDQVIICDLKTADATIAKDQQVTLKGRIVGFDDLMGEIKLDQCFINKN